MGNADLLLKCKTSINNVSVHNSKKLAEVYELVGVDEVKGMLDEI